MPVASRSTAALNRRYLAKLGSRISIAGSGYRSLGSHRAKEGGAAAAIASAAVPDATMVRLVGFIGLHLPLARFDLQFRRRSAAKYRRYRGRLRISACAVT